MKIKISEGASYISILDLLVKPLKTKDIGNGIFVDYDANGEVYGIEILGNMEIEYEEK